MGPAGYGLRAEWLGPDGSVLVNSNVIVLPEDAEQSLPYGVPATRALCLPPEPLHAPLSAYLLIASLAVLLAYKRRIYRPRYVRAVKSRPPTPIPPYENKEPTPVRTSVVEPSRSASKSLRTVSSPSESPVKLKPHLEKEEVERKKSSRSVSSPVLARR